MKPHEKVLVTIKFAKPTTFAEISVVQQTFGGKEQQVVTGGFTYRFGTPKLPRPRTLQFSKPGQGKTQPVRPVTDK